MKTKLYNFEKLLCAMLLLVLFAATYLFLNGRAFIPAIGDFY